MKCLCKQERQIEIKDLGRNSALGGKRFNEHHKYRELSENEYAVTNALLFPHKKPLN